MKRFWNKWHRGLAHLDEDACKLYLSGLSSRQVAAKLKTSKSWVWKLVKSRNLTRDQSSAAVLRQPPQSTHWRSSRIAARKLWERTVGPIPIGYHIHHKDKDYTNNSIYNLEVVNPTEHAYIHHPPNPVPRWLRPERKAYMKAYLKEYAKRVK